VPASGSRRSPSINIAGYLRSRPFGDAEQRQLEQFPFEESCRLEQVAALATDRLAKHGSPLFQYMAIKMPLCSAVLFALELCPGVRSRENALAQTAGL
jgi:hypothetical protein